MYICTAHNWRSFYEQCPSCFPPTTVSASTQPIEQPIETQAEMWNEVWLRMAKGLVIGESSLPLQKEIENSFSITRKH